MRTDKLDKSHVMADDGKVLRRVSDGWIVGKEAFLGHTYYLGGKLLPEPLMEIAEHYEEIEDDQPARSDPGTNPNQYEDLF